MSMAYRNAKDLLPPELYARVHALVGEGLIYFPAREHRPWGELTGTRASLRARNAVIRKEYMDGASIYELSRRYHLAPSTIRGIVRKGMKPVKGTKKAEKNSGHGEKKS